MRFPCSIRANCIVLVIARDITEKKQAVGHMVPDSEALHQFEKLVALFAPGRRLP